MKKHLGWVLLLCTLSLSARADDVSKRAKVEELFTVMKLSEMTERMTAAVRQQIDTALRSTPGMQQITPAQKQLLADYENRSMALANASVGWKALEPEMIDLYASTYTEQEIDGILAFYKSPVGQALLAKTPELTTKSLQITQTKLVALQPKMNELMQDFMRQFAAAGASPTKPSSRPKS